MTALRARAGARPGRRRGRRADRPADRPAAQRDLPHARPGRPRRRRRRRRQLPRGAAGRPGAHGLRGAPGHARADRGRRARREDRRRLLPRARAARSWRSIWRPASTGRAGAWSRPPSSWPAASRTCGRASRMLVAADDAAGTFLRRLIGSGMDYAAQVGPEIADDAVARRPRHALGLHLGARPLRDRRGPARGGARGARGALPRRRGAAAAAGGARRGRPARLAERRPAGATRPARWWSCPRGSSAWSCTPSST